MKFTDRLHEKTLPIWRQNHNHPFVKGIGDGTVDQESFRFYMVQDYLYLIDYSKVFAIGAVKADDVETMGKFAGLLEGTLNTEMALHRKYAARFGISEDELENAEPSPIVLAYTHYMLHVSQKGTLAEVIAADSPMRLELLGNRKRTKCDTGCGRPSALRRLDSACILLKHLES